MNKKKWIYIGILIVVAAIVSIASFSYAFLTRIDEQHGKINVVVGTLDYKIESDDLENNSITLEADGEKEIEITIKSLNKIDSKYELYTNNVENVIIGYLDEDDYDISSGLIESNGIKKVKIELVNESNIAKTIIFGIQGGFVDNSIKLDSNRLAISVAEPRCQVGQVWNFSNTGSTQTFSVPCKGVYKVELWGAQGGNSGTAIGGYGAYTSGVIILEKQDLYINVGGSGASTAMETAQNIAGGYNGGGTTGGQQCCGRYYSSGGGATDIRLTNGTWDNFDSLKSRIMVAAGGGGSYAGNNDVVASNNGGAAGGLVGYDGLQSGSTTESLYCYGKGALQTEGGRITSDCRTASSSYHNLLTGSFGIGGGANGANTGGGGGYYGGSRSYHIASAGGGSSFISGYSGCDAITESSTSSNIVHTNQPNHYSGLYFTDSVMIDGKGCNWKTGTATNCGANQPQPNGTNAAGHAGSGYARITYLGNDKYDYAYNGKEQKFKAPKSGVYTIELWGAQGGTTVSYNTAGGLGGYTKGNIELDRGENLYFYVGSAGSATPLQTIKSTAGGYNGGGATAGQECCARSFASGGGATDVRLLNGNWDNFQSLSSRIMVAGGGGGSYSDGTNNNIGGAGGGLIGINGLATYANGAYCYGEGGTQVSGGKITANCEYASNYGNGAISGGFGYGGSNNSQSTGGGGGYYGGGRSGHVSSAGGGSSFISGYSGCNAISESSTSTNIIHTNQPNHYSGKVFTSSVMIDGKGCNWSIGSAANCGTNQPQPNGTNAVGHSGNGYARITYIGD